MQRLNCSAVTCATAHLSRRSLLHSALGIPALAIGSKSQFATAQTSIPLTLTPQPGTRTAYPGTNIAFRGATAVALGDVFVTASDSGAHSGIVVDHPDGNGCSFVLDDEFFPGETVTVSTSYLLPDGEYTFQIAQPANRAESKTTYVTDQPQAGVEVMHSWVTHPEFMVAQLNITEMSPTSTDGYIFITPSGKNTQGGALIVDRAGEPVWYYTPAQEFYQCYDLKVERYHGQPVLVHAESAKTTGYGFGHFRILNQSYQEIAHIQAGNGIAGLDVHDILITERGTAFVIAYSPVYWDTTAVDGPEQQVTLDGVVQEIDIATGLVYFEWHSLDHIDVAESHKGMATDPETAFDYIHINSVDVDDDGNLLISSRNTHAAYKVSTTTGEVLWRLNGRQSDFEMDENAEFAWAHDVQRQPDGTISMFDNHSDNKDSGEHSRALFLRVDEDSMSVSVDREIAHPTEILSTSQSNVQVLENGDVFVGWGSSPVFSEFSPTGELIYNGRFPNAISSYRAQTFNWIGRPSTPPLVAIDRAESGAYTLALSWNGATELRQWQILAGDAASDFDVVITVEKSGFETLVEIETSAPMIRVAALDADGTLLAETDAIVLDSTWEHEAGGTPDS